MAIPTSRLDDIQKEFKLNVVWEPDISADPNALETTRSPTLTIFYGERIGSPGFAYQGNTAKLRAQYMCYWPDRWLFIRKMLGFPLSAHVAASAPRHIKRSSPIGYPHLRRPYNAPLDVGSSQAALYPTSVDSCEGLAPASKNPGEKSPTTTDELYSRALVTLSYDTVPYSIKPDNESVIIDPLTTTKVICDLRQAQGVFYTNRYITKIPAPASEYLRLPTGFYRWVEAQTGPPGSTYTEDQKKILAAGSTSTVSYQRINSYVDLTYIWHAVPAVQSEDGGETDDHIDISGPPQLYLGCVNSLPFDGYPPETLLLMSVEAKVYRLLTGDRVYDYIFKMRYFNPYTDPTDASKYAGHNHFLRYTTFANSQNQPIPAYHRLTVNGRADGPTMFRRRPFHELFFLQSLSRAKSRLQLYMDLNPTLYPE